jgi:hypothetical protein
MRDLEAFRTTLSDALDQCDRALRMKETLPCPVVSHLASENE